MGPENHHRHSRDWKGIVREYYAMPYGDRYIWGVTAGILRNLYERLYGSEPGADPGYVPAPPRFSGAFECRAHDPVAHVPTT